MDLIKRPRRLRTSENIRRLVRDTGVSVNDLIYPLFVVEGKGIKREIPSMPGVYHFSVDCLLKELEEVQQLGIPGILLFGIPEAKDEMGSGAYDVGGIIQRALREVKAKFPQLLLVADVCLCEYTSHGHCGVVEDDRISNDRSVDLIVKSALSYAEAGADIIAPSDMMDGRVGAIKPLWPIVPNIPQPFTGPSGMQPSRNRPLVTARPTRWTMPISVKLCARLNWI
jgi:porphobilinogen synthase